MLLACWLCRDCVAHLSCCCAALAFACGPARMRYHCICVLPCHPGDGASGEVFGAYYKQQRVAVKARREGKGQAEKRVARLRFCGHCHGWNAGLRLLPPAATSPGSAHSPVTYLSQPCAPSLLPVMLQVFVAERSPDGHSRDEMAIAFSGEGLDRGVGSKEGLGGGGGPRSGSPAAASGSLERKQVAWTHLITILHRSSCYLGRPVWRSRLSLWCASNLSATSAVSDKHLVRVNAQLQEPLGLVMEWAEGTPMAQKPNHEVGV